MLSNLTPLFGYPGKAQRFFVDSDGPVKLVVRFNDTNEAQLPGKNADAPERRFPKVKPVTFRSVIPAFILIPIKSLFEDHFTTF